MGTGDEKTVNDRKDEQRESFLVGNETVDYLGRRADKSKTGGWTTAPLIFGAEMCERMAAYGIVYNLVTYLVGNLHLTRPYSSNMVTNMTGTSFGTCLIGGFVADTYLGRFWTIVTFGFIQFLGLLLITLFAALPHFQLPHCSPPEVPCQAVHGSNLSTLYIALYLIALGTGGIKACVSGFGADQFDINDPREKKQMLSFFNWFFFFISFGSVFAVTLLVYVQDKLGRGWGFGITASCMVVALVALLAGRTFYRYSLVKGSPLTQIARVFITAFKNYKLPLPSDRSELHDAPPLYEKIAHTDQFLFLSKAAIKTPRKWTADDLEPSEKELTAALTVTQVEEVKSLVRVLPVLATTFLFWTVYAQMTTFSVQQAVNMNRKLGSSFEIPPASVATILHSSIMVMTALYDRFLVRWFRHFTKRPEGITLLQRIGVGLVLSIVAMVAAALVEERRLKAVHRYGSNYHISVFWLVPQYFLVGAGEAFTYVGQLEFFYKEAPTGMRSMGTAICLCTLSFGFYSSSIIVDIIDSISTRGSSAGWFAENLDMGHLDRFYWLLAVVSSLNFLCYLLVSRWYHYRPKHNDEATNAIDQEVPRLLLVTSTKDENNEVVRIIDEEVPQLLRDSSAKD